MADIKKYEANTAKKELTIPSNPDDISSGELKLLSDDAADREQKRIRIKNAFDRPAQYKRLVNEQIILNQELLILKIKKTKDTNRIFEKKSIEGDNYSDVDYQRDLDRVNKFYDRKIETVRGKITLNSNKLRSLDDNFFGLIDPNRVKKSEEDKRKIREARAKERRIRFKLKSQIKLQLIKRFKDEPNKLRAVINGISFIATIYLQKVGTNNAKVEILVDNVLAIIEDAKTDPTVEKLKNAKNERDLALQYIQLNRIYLESLINLVNSLSLIQNILSGILAILYLIPFPSPPKVFKVISQISQAVEDLAGLLNTVNFLISKLLEDLNFQESRLLEASGFLDGNLDDLTPEDILDLIGDGLGYMNGFDYKGFRFFIREEENPAPEFVIKGNKRRYVAALDASDIERLRSDYSFTLDPNVLVEQLKLEIDKQNLVA